jgi:hypothetical protein
MNGARRLRGLTLLALGTLAAASPASGSTGDVITLDELENAAYVCPGPDEIDVKLRRGVGSTGGGKFDDWEYRYWKSALGDLDGDGAPEAAVLLISEGGFSNASIVNLAILGKTATLRCLAAIVVGNKIGVESLTVVDREVRVEALVHGPDDPMVDPTEHQTMVYRLASGKLVETKVHSVDERPAKDPDAVPAAIPASRPQPPADTEPQSMREWLADAVEQLVTGMPKSYAREAIGICRQFMTSRLLAPSTAAFPSSNFTESNVKAIDELRYEVVGEVDAENFFGARLRGRYTCLVEKEQPGFEDRWWTLISLISDQPSQLRDPKTYHEALDALRSGR